MAVKTAFSLEQLQGLLSGYDIGLVTAVAPLTQGNDQTNLQITTEVGKYVFRYYEKRSENYVRYEIDLLDHISRQDFPSPAPIPNRNGSPIGNHASKPFVLFEFMPGKHSTSDENAVQVAEAIGQLHQLTENFEPHFSESRAVYDANYVLSFTVANRHLLPEQEANDRANWLKTELAAIELPISMPKGAVHGDLNPSNFLYEDDKLSAVLDFDQSSYTYLVHDVSQLLYWWAWKDPDQIDWALAKKLLQGYESQRTLTDDERNHLYDMLIMTNLISIGWDFASDDLLESQRRVNYLKSIGREGIRMYLFLEPYRILPLSSADSEQEL